ncbi:hypothetical protein LRAMOSA07355 [Lichtheimia ramosa]|uniref:EamA domain-containing protein n=1 Tax=Lichtheimia ramosa TaxID=688394 RepID=A0A077WBK0_9FUNG|nr:hypothetical protein LRAMOSA07355 [Lichtheimia ramosa]
MSNELPTIKSHTLFCKYYYPLSPFILYLLLSPLLLSLSLLMGCGVVCAILLQCVLCFEDRWVSHCGYIFMGALQLIAECIARRHMPHKNIVHLIRLTIKECKQEVIESAATLESRPRQWIYRIMAITVLLTLPAYLWFVSVNLTTMSTLTAIYNTGCFFAYLFSILILGDPIMRSKVMAVLLCIIGVGIMAYWADDNDNDNGDDKSGIMGLLGILVATTCAATYGFYEVFYKKIASPAQPSVLFANVVTTGIGLATLLLLWIPIPLLHWTGYETFQMPDPITFGYILCVGSMSVIYNATFMCVIALANPVFAAVGVMLTVPAVAIVDVLVTGVMIPTATIVGSILILIGFYILNRDMKNNDQ